MRAPGLAFPGSPSSPPGVGWALGSPTLAGLWLLASVAPLSPVLLRRVRCTEARAFEGPVSWGRVDAKSWHLWAAGSCGQQEAVGRADFTRTSRVEGRTLGCRAGLCGRARVATKAGVLAPDRSEKVSPP